MGIMTRTGLLTGVFMSNSDHVAGRKCGIISAVTLLHSSTVCGLGEVGSINGMWMSFTSDPVFLQFTSSPPLQSEMCASLTKALICTTLPSPIFWLPTGKMFLTGWRSPNAFLLNFGGFISACIWVRVLKATTVLWVMSPQRLFFALLSADFAAISAAVIGTYAAIAAAHERIRGCCNLGQTATRNLD
ncbi:MAG: hypothetical protein DMG38_21140 [Acidobacteria bacterium]|nr:MAG: hypothetical protein DMG38_21140 [Acidobacteriota bacterium]